MKRIINTRKTLVGGSNDGGDKKSPRKSLEKTHIAYTLVKRKRNLSLVDINASEVQEIPHAMDMDEIIEEPSWFVQNLLETREISDAMMTRILKYLKRNPSLCTMRHTIARPKNYC